MQEHMEKRRDHQRVLFLLLSLESWYDVFMRGEGQADFSGSGQAKA
jgi:hypothetical protein